MFGEGLTYVTNKIPVLLYPSPVVPTYCNRGWVVYASNLCSEGGELLATGRSYFVRQAVELFGNCMAGGQHGGCFR